VLVRCPERVGARRRRHGNDAQPAAGTQFTRLCPPPVRAADLDEWVGEEVEQRQKVDDHDHRVRQPAQTPSRLKKLE